MVCICCGCSIRFFCEVFLGLLSIGCCGSEVFVLVYSTLPGKGEDRSALEAKYEKLYEPYYLRKSREKKTRRRNNPKVDQN
ncbi:hypothetical protein LWI28_024562 [Acer negundo]|uniref:Uncharacterized protein n=1 Tax=Acer negundo TaxID=4023 RepID=A0AAD5NSX9_ACENE|nr:hypothetical protein LWI28_024562 [Acer negundo]